MKSIVFVSCLLAFLFGCSRQPSYLEALQILQLEQQILDNLLAKKSTVNVDIENNLDLAIRENPDLKANTESQSMVIKRLKEQFNAEAKAIIDAAADRVDNVSKQVALAIQLGDATVLENAALGDIVSSGGSILKLNAAAAAHCEKIKEAGVLKIKELERKFNAIEIESLQSLQVARSELVDRIKNQIHENAKEFAESLDVKIELQRKRVADAQKQVRSLAP